MPLEGERWIEPLGRVDRPNQEGPLINARWVSPGYFETTRQKLIAGRFFEDRDRNLNSSYYLFPRRPSSAPSKVRSAH
jgi:hypothetical protein